jgi:hypothetical protein
MTAPPLVSCEGAPRDLGLDQGTACAAAIRDRASRAGAPGDWLGRWRPYEGPRGQRRAALVARDLRRHFPHLDERVIGLSRGADVSERALHYLLARELTPDGEGARLRVMLESDGRLGLVSSASPGILRRATPDAYFPSLEWTLPWLPGAYAGVNGGGLAGAVRSPGQTEPSGCAAPAFLLLQNCLHQFDSVAAAAEWCESRPSGGHAEILLCDARGGCAGLVIDGEKRMRVEPRSGDAPASEPDALRIRLDARARTLEAGALRLEIA